MGIKSNIQFYNTIFSNGFDLASCKSINTHDGSCWNATLVYGKTKIAIISNGGHGGPNEFHYFPTKTDSNAAQQELINKFWALPPVVKMVRDNLIMELGWEVEFGRMSDAEYSTKRETILNSTPSLNLESVADVVEQFMNGKKCVKTFKGKQAKKTCLVLKNAASEYEWNEYNIPDTPENRERLKKQVGDKLDYFIADILDSVQTETN